MKLFHPLHTNIEKPNEMNNPFDYEPHPLCMLAVEKLLPLIPQNDEGKMFGVLVVENQEGELGYLAAYSGQINGMDDDEIFVPAIFDYLQPDGYFKTHEAEITNINHSIHALEHDERFLNAEKKLNELKEKRDKAVDEYKLLMQKSKALRDERRKKGNVSKEEDEAMIKESQFQKAELRRIKSMFSQPIDTLYGHYTLYLQEVEELKHLRKQLSDALQSWLFSQFNILNLHGESKNLLEIFADTVQKIPPSGAGECCEPKLLQYAFLHHLKPISMAMFWFGPSPKQEIRHHLHYYPACRGKCLPILTWMLDLGNTASLPSQVNDKDGNILNDRIIYEDIDLIVVDKPAGMLSVPGKTNEISVYDIMHERCQDAECLQMVHRLDQATSGLLVIAKNKKTHKQLQSQFANHLIQKKYVALLSHPMTSAQREGTITLPMRPDPLNRPYQIIDEKHGKTAITEYKMMDEYRIWLFPHTGRTHQLRVHCAHQLGLNNPIKGDALYGMKDERLFLHAESIQFIHPSTNEMVYFEAKAPF